MKVYLQEAVTIVLGTILAAAISFGFVLLAVALHSHA